MSSGGQLHRSDQHPTTKLLHNKLNGRSLELPRPTNVALGSEDRYYIEFADGTAQWSGPDGIDKYLRTGGEADPGFLLH